MMNDKRTVRTPVWATGLFIVTLVVGSATILYASLSDVALRNHATIEWLGFDWPIVMNGYLYVALAAVVMLLATIWYEACYGARVRRWRQVVLTCFVLMVSVGAMTISGCKCYQDSLAHSGIGTMQRALDIEYHQEEMKLMGVLGFYAGQLNVDGETKIYLCRQMETFGPFDEQILADMPEQSYSTGYENYLRFEQDNLTQIRALSVQHYQDGYWLVVKRLVNIDDLYLEIATIDDLRRYVAQMQYSCHTGAEDELMREFEEITDGAIYRR